MFSRDEDEVTLLPGKNIKRQRGQVFILLALLVPILIVFTGIGIDLGLAYVTKSTLSKAVDAAALTAMKNINLGTGSLPNCSLTSGAAVVGLDTFNVNYKSLPGLGATPTPSICFSLDANNNTIVSVSATATINTHFLRAMSIIPGVTTNYDTLSVNASATAQRNPMIMSLVLDVSYSMEENGGSSALAPAVEAFIADFDPNNNDTIDYASMVTFGTSAVVNVANTQPFKDSIDTAVSKNFWSGGVINYTNSQAGLLDGQTQIADQASQVASGENVIKVLVFFTDGWPNMQQDTLTCPAATKGGPTTTADLIYCGCDPGDESLGLCQSTGGEFFNPSSCSTANNSCSAPTSGCGSIPRLRSSLRIFRISRLTRPNLWSPALISISIIAAGKPQPPDKLSPATRCIGRSRCPPIPPPACSRKASTFTRSAWAARSPTSRRPRNFCARSPTIPPPPPTILTCRSARRCLPPAPRT